MSESVQTNLPKPRGIRAVSAFFRAHKILAALLILLLAGAILLGVGFARRGRAAAAGGSYSFIRTTVLTRGSLDETVSATGSVESADTSTVSYSAMGQSSAKIKTVHVAVGDAVEAGDVIVTLDNTDILEAIGKEQETLTEQKTAAQESYDEAVAARDEAYAAAVAYESTVSQAKTALSKAQLAYETAEKSIAVYQSDYDTKSAALTAAGTRLNAAGCAAITRAQAEAALAAAETGLSEAAAAVQAAQTAYDAAKAAAAAAPEDAALSQAAADAQTALTGAQAEQAAKQTAVQTAQSHLSLASDYEAAAAAEQEAAAVLRTAKTNCSYDSLQQAYQAAQQSYNAARTTLDNYQKQYSNALDQVEQAAERLEEVGSSETLEELYDQLDACELKAETAGKVTALNATVGSTPNGTVATIQNTDSLKISITISEADINDVQLGMRCVITSDATEQEIDGVLTQIDPVAGMSGSFGAEVTVSESGTGLLIGMNATVKIVLSSTEEVFNVPIDAVGNDEDGKGDYVYRRTGGEGVDMTFEKVYVTTGQANDYYIEIDSDELAVGDVIRSSADLTQGLETVETDGESGLDLGGLMGGLGGTQMGGNGSDRTGGTNSGRGQGGGDMPSGGGNMPSGGGGFPGGN